MRTACRNRFWARHWLKKTCRLVPESLNQTSVARVAQRVFVRAHAKQASNNHALSEVDRGCESVDSDQDVRKLIVSDPCSPVKVSNLSNDGAVRTKSERIFLTGPARALGTTGQRFSRTWGPVGWTSQKKN